MKILAEVQEVVSLLKEILQELRLSGIESRLKWVGTEGAAAICGCSPYTFRNEIATRPDFPKPVRPTGGVPKYNVEDINAWLRKHQGEVKRIGRPRAA